MASTSKEEKVSSQTTEKDNELNRNMKKENQEVVRVKVGAEAELPFLEKFLYFCVYSYFLAMAAHKIYLFPLGKCFGLFEHIHYPKCFMTMF